MAASIRSWVKDRLTRYEAKNKVELTFSPGAEVQVEKWLTYESPYWARVCDREHSIVIRVSDEAAQRFFDQYETACTTLLRGVISITPFQPTVARLRPASEPQLILDVKGFNTKAMGGDVLFYPDVKELAEDPWAREWAGRIVQAHPEQAMSVVFASEKSTEVAVQARAAVVEPQQPKPPGASSRKVRDASKVNLLELGWCVVSKDQRELLDREYPCPPVRPQYAHLFPAGRAAPSPVEAAAPGNLPTALRDPLHLEEDAEASDDELPIKPPPARVESLKRPAPAAADAATTATTAEVRPHRRTSSSPPPQPAQADIGSSQSHTVTHSSPSHFSASLDVQGLPPAAKRARLSLASATQGDTVLVPASDSDIQSQESRVASQAHSGGSGGDDATKSSGSADPATSSRDQTTTTESVSSGAPAAGPGGYRPLTASTVDEPPFTLGQHNISLQIESPSTTTASANLPVFSIDDGLPSGSGSGGSSAPISSGLQHHLQLPTQSQTTASTESTQPLGANGDGDVVMRELTASTVVSTEVFTTQENETDGAEGDEVMDEQADVDQSLGGGPAGEQQPPQAALADESHTDDEMVIEQEMGLEAAKPALTEAVDAAVEGDSDMPLAEAEVDRAVVVATVPATVEEGALVAEDAALPGPIDQPSEQVQATGPSASPLAAAPPESVDDVNHSASVSQDLVGSSSGDAELVDALTQSLPPTPAAPVAAAAATAALAVSANLSTAPTEIEADDDEDVVEDSQPPSRTESHADVGQPSAAPVPAEAVAALQSQPLSSAEGQEAVPSAPEPASVSVSQPAAVDPAPTTVGEGRPSSSISSPPPPPSVGLPPPLPPSPAPAPAQSNAKPNPTVKREVVDLRSVSPEISIIEPPARPASSTATTTATTPAAAAAVPVVPKPRVNPPSASNPGYTSQALRPAPPPPPPPPPPPAPPKRPPTYVPPKPTFTLSRTLDLPRDHGLPMYDDVMDILRRAQAYQMRQAR